MIILTEDEKTKFKQWVIENVDETVVPIDEGNGNGLKYNLIHLIFGDGKVYDYKEEQDKEVENSNGC